MGPRLKKMGFRQMKMQCGREQSIGESIERVRIAGALSTPIAAGEYVYGITPVRHLLEHRSIDIVLIAAIPNGLTVEYQLPLNEEAFECEY